MAGDASPSTDPVQLAQDRFIALWGRMGSSWGIPRTMAQVHALLYIVGEPMNTDDIMARLRISRGSASMTLKNLQDWGIVSRAVVPGERKDLFTTSSDIWKLFRTVLRERKKREIDPLIDALRNCRELTDSHQKPRRLFAASRTRDSHAEEHNKRLDAMIDFLTMIDALAQQLIQPSGKGLALAAKFFSRAS
ncbi:MAG TPA: MarR family transcriptional regulator [Phycisphaerales bacterium]|nr:MarR family transcriptional regulator [Phycisphaerales bacterium]